MQLNHDRLLDSLRQLAQFGKSGTGVNRLSFTPEDRAARAWLLEQMRAAGLDARIDGIGNVYGQATDVDRAVLIGSHTDSVPKGGWLDGAMGVLYGLEVARTRHESQASNGPARSDEYAALARLGVDVISFADEEGPTVRWPAACLFAASYRIPISRARRPRAEPRSRRRSPKPDMPGSRAPDSIRADTWPTLKGISSRGRGSRSKTKRLVSSPRLSAFGAAA